FSLLSILPRPPTSPLFPYTTLFRSIWAVIPVKDTALAKQRLAAAVPPRLRQALMLAMLEDVLAALAEASGLAGRVLVTTDPLATDRKSTRLNSSHVAISYAVFCLKK